MADMKHLKASLPSAEKLAELKPGADALYDRKKVIRDEMSKIKEEVDMRSSEIDKLRAKQEEVKAARNENRNEID